jgi:hypothetical protein
VKAFQQAAWNFTPSLLHMGSNVCPLNETATNREASTPKKSGKTPDPQDKTAFNKAAKNFKQYLLK